MIERLNREIFFYAIPGATLGMLMYRLYELEPLRPLFLFLPLAYFFTHSKTALFFLFFIFHLSSLTVFSSLDLLAIFSASLFYSLPYLGQNRAEKYNFFFVLCLTLIPAIQINFLTHPLVEALRALIQFGPETVILYVVVFASAYRLARRPKSLSLVMILFCFFLFGANYKEQNLAASYVENSPPLTPKNLNPTEANIYNMVRAELKRLRLEDSN